MSLVPHISRLVATRLPNAVRHWRRIGRCVAAFAALGPLIGVVHGADSSRDAVLKNEPLATCPVDVRTSTGTRAVQADVALTNAVVAVQSGGAADDAYLPARRRDWQRGAVDAEDPWIRLAVATPSGLLVIDVAVFVEGQPFRGVEEAAVERLASSSQRSSAPPVQSASGSHEEDQSEPHVDPSITVEADVDSPPDDAVTEDKDAVPVVSTSGRGQVGLVERLASYAAEAGGAVSPDELRWLIQQWTAGPSPRLLRPEFAWQRAGVAPLLAILDRDGDGQLSVPEIEGAQQRLATVDVNQDRIVDRAELFGGSPAGGASLQRTGGPVLAIIDSDADWRTFLRRTDADDPSAMPPADADVTLRIDFASSETQLGVLAVSERVASSASGATCLLVKALKTDLQIAAVDGAAVTGTADDAWPATIAVGAVWDGFPLLRLADGDGDGRLSLRETRATAANILLCDENGDGQLTRDELHGPLRLVVCRGLVAQDDLSAPSRERAAARAVAAHDVVAPDWFAAMDLNQDGDIARDEFPGAAAQFAEFDQDGDGLISVAEAAAVESAADAE